MLNFAEQTGSGAVILVWSFLPSQLVGSLISRIPTVAEPTRGTHTTAPPLSLLILLNTPTHALPVEIRPGFGPGLSRNSELDSIN